MSKVAVRHQVPNCLDAAMPTLGVRREALLRWETAARMDTRAVKFYLKKSGSQQLGLHAIGEIATRTISNGSEPRPIPNPL